ncbi:MAG: hypothetical protein AB2L14_03335 [Candidatus Xenobiia bacterium LiM19]
MMPVIHCLFVIPGRRMSVPRDEELCHRGRWERFVLSTHKSPMKDFLPLPTNFIHLTKDREMNKAVNEPVLLRRAELPLETVILLVAGLMMLITGIVLFPVSSGVLPCYENGLYGLVMVIFALQIITMGKTPFGDMRRSKALLAIGMVIAAAGIVTCFIPIILSRYPRLVLVLFLGPGSFLLLLQMVIAREKLRAWLQYGGIFRHLVIGCGLVYTLSMLFAGFLWQRGPLAAPATALTALVYGAAIIYLALVLRKVYTTYPEAEKLPGGDAEISADNALILMLAVFMLLLGLLLIPVSLRLLPFSGSAQLGLMMVIFALQMLASGSTPIGVFPRSWLMIAAGILFAALGIVSAVIPEVLVPCLKVLVGAMNILGGILTLWKICAPGLRRQAEPEPPLLKRLFAAQVAMSLLSILFGTSVFMASLLPGPILGVILTANGCVLLYMLHILIQLDRLK